MFESEVGSSFVRPKCYNRLAFASRSVTSELKFAACDGKHPILNHRSNNPPSRHTKDDCLVDFHIIMAFELMGVLIWRIILACGATASMGRMSKGKGPNFSAKGSNGPMKYRNSFNK